MSIKKQNNKRELAIDKAVYLVDDNTKTYANYLFKDDRLRYRQRRVFRRYITRDGDPSSTKFILSTEELATVFHIPDMSITSPNISHVSSKRGGAPINLPIEE